MSAADRVQGISNGARVGVDFNHFACGRDLRSLALKERYADALRIIHDAIKAANPLCAVHDVPADSGAIVFNMNTGKQIAFITAQEAQTVAQLTTLGLATVKALIADDRVKGLRLQRTFSGVDLAELKKP